MTNTQRQLEKEKAIRLGIERGMALMRDELKMYGVTAEGKKEFICESKEYESLWADTIKALEDMPKIENKTEEYLNNWKRERADFLNYKKEEAKRLEEFARFANEAVILEVIEVIDDLEKASKEVKNEGLDQVLKKFQDLLRKYGVERIEVKDIFDPLLHEAVTTETQNESENVGEKEEKLEEVRAGYTMHGQVIRPTRVKIIK